MVVGFNHNFRYQGDVYHIQTEDSGMLNPNIVTLLYQGGTILASKKTSYADIAKIDNLEQVVEELMKEQHRNMLRALKSGEFDGVIERFKTGKKVTPEVAGAATEGNSPLLEKPVAQDPNPVLPRTVVPVASPQAQDEGKPHSDPTPQTLEKGPAPAIEVSLDEVILSYLIGDKE